MKKKGLLLVFLTAVISGFAIFLNAFGVKEINPFIFAGMKNTIVMAVLFLSFFVVKDFKSLKELKKKQWSQLMLVGLVGGSVPFLLFFQGLQLSTGALGSLIHKTMFVFVIILAALFLREKVSKKVIIAVIALLAGNFFLLRADFSFNLGHLLIFSATVLWAVENIISKHLLKTLSSRTVAFGRMFFGSLFIMVFLIATNQFRLIASITSTQLSWILITSFILFLYVTTWYGGLKHVKVSTATAILLLGSPITTLLSFLFLGKAIVASEVLGILFILVGVATLIGFKWLTQKAVETASDKSRF